jgi:sigma-B regulation protein RsbU (phosphoserine phosphatase)
MAYLADVSGHGVAPGVLMAMVKSAARMQLSSGGESVKFLERMNAVLYPIKKPEMFATFAYLAWNGQRMEFSLAGHPAILHYCAATQEIAEVSCSNLPVGMFYPQEFVHGDVACGPGDLFLLLTDGVLEVENAAGKEFGVPGVSGVLQARAREPLEAVFQGIVDAAAKYGRAVDDQSMLMVRCKAD